MDADQKLTELKKAYADMILNTTTEAAARIMVSERKAIRLELELKNSKENAIQMLMRLKQMMDSKISEAEIASRSQQKRIEELEAQLQEAEDIVKDLREKLTAVNGVQEVKHMVQVNEASEKNVFLNPEEDSNVVSNSNKDESNKGNTLYNSLFPFLKSYIDEQDLPAIILRRKGTKTYRSGCTQRIHACEQNNHINNDLIMKVGEETEKLRMKKRTSSLNQPLDQVNEMDNSCLTTTKSNKFSIWEKNPNEVINTDTGLVNASDVYRRMREELVPLGREKTELPLSSEAKVDFLESTALLTDVVPSQLTNSRVIKYTFQRKRKRVTLTTNGSDLSNKLKRKEEETEKVKKSTQEEEEENLEEVAHQLISLSEKKWCQ